jgi:hypothetical protein
VSVLEELLHILPVPLRQLALDALVALAVGRVATQPVAEGQVALDLGVAAAAP